MPEGVPRENRTAEFPGVGLAAFLDTLADGFVALDREWRFVYLNAAGARTLGRPAGNLVGRVLWQEFPELTDTDFGRLYRRAMAEGVALALEGYYPPFDAWFSVRAQPSAAGLALSFQDVSERRRGEAAARAQNLELENRVVERTYEFEVARQRAELLAALADALQGTHTLEEVARAALERLGPSLRATSMVASRLEADYLRPLAAWGELPPELKPYLTGPGLPLARAGISRRVVKSGEAFYSADYGTEAGAIPLSARIALGIEPVKAADGSVVAVVSALRDHGAGLWRAGERELLGRAAATTGLALERAEATARLRAQAEALAEARTRAELLAALADALQEAHTVEKVAERALELIGPAVRADYLTLMRREGETLRPHSSWGTVPAGLLALARDGLPRGSGGWQWRAVLEGRGAYTSDYLAEPDRLPAAAPPFALAIEPVAANGRALGTVSAGRDPALGPWTPGERDLLERAAAALGLALERAEAEALLLRQRDALAAQTAELEARNAEAEAFIYTVSHDLRSPLLAIQGMGALLEEAVSGGEADEARFLLGRVNRNVERMGQLLNDLLEFSRVGRAAEAPQTLDLLEVASSVAADLEGPLRERGVALELPAASAIVLYPRTELEQVIANLLGNAAKFAGRGGEPPRVALGWTREGNRVVLRVSDNGPGVPPEFRAKVWSLFQKLDPKAEGTGVGLAIVKRIAERHGGAAWVEDSSLGGATFAVSLPAAPV